MTRELILGAMEPPIATQLSGMNFTPDQLKRWQRFADSITLLHLHGFMSDTAARQARNRLVTMIQKGLT